MLLFGRCVFSRLATLAACLFIFVLAAQGELENSHTVTRSTSVDVARCDLSLAQMDDYMSPYVNYQVAAADKNVSASQLPLISRPPSGSPRVCG